MQVENVAGECFTSGRTAEQQGHLPVGNSLFGQVIVNDEGVLAVVAVVFSHGAAGVGCDVLQGSGLGSCSGNDGGVFHRTVLAQGVCNQCHVGLLLADGNVEAVDVRVLLSQDGVDADSGLTGLTVTDDELALATADGGHGVNGFQAGRHGLAN